MARLGVLADVHGNVAALTRALQVLDDAHVEGIVCLGDLVGYHPDGDACVEMLLARDARCVAGNHDLIAAGLLNSDRCGSKAKHALARARRDIGQDTARVLASLPVTRLVGGRIGCIHGGVDDVCEYLSSADRVRDNARRFARRFPHVRACLFGHTHVPAVYVVENGVARREAARGTVQLSRPGATVFANPGSVDAARRAGDEALFAILDTERMQLTFLGARYDDRATERRARAAGYRRPRTAWARAHLATLKRLVAHAWGAS
jgi:predicted phosphodiesterase